MGRVLVRPSLLELATIRPQSWNEVAAEGCG